MRSKAERAESAHTQAAKEGETGEARVVRTIEILEERDDSAAAEYVRGLFWALTGRFLRCTEPAS